MEWIWGKKFACTSESMIDFFIRIITIDWLKSFVSLPTYYQILSIMIWLTEVCMFAPLPLLRHDPLHSKLTPTPSEWIYLGVEARRHKNERCCSCFLLLFSFVSVSNEFGLPLSKRGSARGNDCTNVYRKSPITHTHVSVESDWTKMSSSLVLIL